MTTAYATSHTGHAASAAKTGAAAGIRRLFSTAWEHFLYARALSSLRRLNSEELAALGISRFELPGVARELVRVA